MILDILRNELTQIPAVRAGYVIGSHSDGTAVAGSDIDLVIIVEAGTDGAARQAIEARITEVSGSATLDLEILEATETDKLNNPSFKLGSDLLMGEDIRASIPLISMDAWARDRLHTSYWRTNRFFDRPRSVTLPLNYPKPDDSFLGYVVDGKTRQLLRHITWAATALIAHQGQRYVARKADVPRIYREAVGGDFTSYIEQVYTRCKIDWHYVIPADAPALLDLCRQTLDFENHFMGIYRPFLLQELSATEPEIQAHALWLMSQLPLMDADVRALLENLSHDHPVEAIRLQVAEILRMTN